MGLKRLITELIDEARREKERDKRFGLARGHIKLGDAALLATTTEGIDFTRDQRNDLLKAAFEADNPALFQTLLDKIGKSDPNTAFYVFLSGSGLNTQESLLFHAIAWGKPNIALMLAENPRTDIRFAGSKYVSDNSIWVNRDYGFTPLEAARNVQGMEKVVSALALRTIALRLTEIEELKKEIILPPGLQKPTQPPAKDRKLPLQP